MILTVTTNPCVDKTVFIDALEPGAKIRAPKCTCIPGGKGNNVSRAVKALGYETAAFNILAGRAGQHVADMITEQDGVRCIPVWVSGMTRTITTVLEEPIHRQTALFEPGPQLTEEEVAAVAETFRGVIGEARVVTFNGAVPCVSLQPLYRDLIRIAHEAGVLTVLDTYGPELALGLEARPHMVKPNDVEAAGLVGFPLDSRDAQWRAIEALHGRGVPCVVLSLGADGALVSAHGEQLHAVPEPIETINPVGSGDALVAAFAIGLQEGWPLTEMARMGVAAGTANAMSWDIGHFTRAEVERVAEHVHILPR